MRRGNLNKYFLFPSSATRVSSAKKKPASRRGSSINGIDLLQAKTSTKNTYNHKNVHIKNMSDIKNSKFISLN